MLASRLRQLAGLAGAAVLAAACASSAPKLKPSALPSKAAAAPPKPKPAKERLLAALRAVDRAPPVLELLSRPALTVLDTRLPSLTPEQRKDLIEGELAESMPLLHLKAGGSSGRALFALATSPAAARELPQAFELLGQVSDEDRLRLVKLAHDVAQRSALHFLRDRVLDVSGAPAKDLPPLLGAIEAVAITAERPDIVRLALETWAASGAPVEVMSALGVACARELDEKCFAEVLAGVAESARPEHARLLRLEKALKTRRDGDAIVKAWSLLQLGRDAQVFLGGSLHGG